MNIVAIASAYGVGAISVIRLGGKDAYEIAQKLCRSTLTPRHAHLKKLYSKNNELLDEAIVIYFKAPFSYTGDDLVEFQTHGGLVVANLIVDELLNLGARVANPGEFTKIALLNNKIDLAKAESISALINAKSQSAAKILARAMSGEISEFVNELRSELITILAHCEVCIDYAEEDLPSDILDGIKFKLTKSARKLSDIVKFSLSRQGLIDGVKIAIIGKPNVGKSSLLNALLHYNRAIVSEIAGTTRDTVEEQIKIGSHLVRIIDTAGIRDNACDIEKIGIEYSKRAANDADIIICVFDRSAKSDNQDIQILNFLQTLNKKIIFVLNKADLSAKFDLNLDKFNAKIINLSAKIDSKPLFDELENALNLEQTNEIILSSNRQIIATQNALNALNLALEKLSESELEIFAKEINTAIKFIGSITTPMENNELLDAVFGEFCLGK